MAASDPDRPILIRTVVLATSVFTLLALIVGGYLLAQDRVGLFGFIAVALGGTGLGVLTGLLIYRMSGIAAGGVAHMLTGAGNISPTPSFSYEEALVMQGKHGEAVESFRNHLRQHPTDREARLVLAGLLAGPVKDVVEAEREYLAIRAPGASPRQELVASRALIDLYAASGQRGKQMAELARFAERFRGTPEGDGAKRALLELKQSPGPPAAPH